MAHKPDYSQENGWSTPSILNSPQMVTQTKQPGRWKKWIFRLLLILGVWYGFHAGLLQALYSKLLATGSTSTLDASSDTMIDWNEINHLLIRWNEVHHHADHSWDQSLLPTVLTGEALTQQQETIQTLKQKDCRWTFSEIADQEVLNQKIISRSEVVVTIRKHWDADLYCQGKYDRGSFDRPFSVTYRIIQMPEGWRIAQKDVIEK